MDTLLLVNVLLLLVYFTQADYYPRQTRKGKARSVGYDDSSSQESRDRYRQHDAPGPGTTEDRFQDSKVTFEYGESDEGSRGTVRRDTTPREQLNCVEGLCENVPGYPAADIRSSLETVKVFDDYFRALQLETIENRISETAGEEQMCKTREHRIYPQKANNSRHVERTIVNIDDKKQMIVFDTCLENSKCAFSETFPDTYTSECKQKYVKRRLVVLGDEREKLAFDTFDVPSCCVCVLTQKTVN